MGRHKSRPEPGSAKPFNLTFTPDLHLDLWAFCEVHHGAPRHRIIESAVRAYIDAELQAHPTKAAEWRALRETVRTKPQLVQFPTDKPDSET
jgi:hypothetical protein